MERLCALFNTCVENSEVPDEWRHMYLVSLHKKGPRNDPNNYRGIAITPSVSRLFGKIITNVMRQDLDRIYGEDQSGFRPG